MNPAVSPASGSFDIEAPIVGETALEHSLTLLKRNAGRSVDADPADINTLPNLKNLEIQSVDRTAFYSVFSQDNLLANPGLALANYNYLWQVDSFSGTGTAVRLRFETDKERVLTLTVSHPDNPDLQQDYQFIIGKIKQ
jgi:hypothetical protein